MKVALSDLWRLDGTIGRGRYALIGCLLFAVKHNLDRFLATFLFDRKWDVFSYLQGPPLGAEGQAGFYLAMVTLALPFIWTGIALTLRRLRDAGLPMGLLVLFFVPFVNLLFFLSLSLVPSRKGAAPEGARPGRLGRLLPEGVVGSAAVSVLVTAFLAVPMVILAVTVLKQYGAGLFVGLPFALGFASALIHGYHTPRSLAACLAVASLGMIFLCMLLVALAVEGLLCLVMAAPIMLVLVLLGATVGYFLQRRGLPPRLATTALGMALAAAPILMGAERAAELPAPLFEVRSAVLVAAPPDVVWHSVVSFSDIPPPTEWLFRAGIAYPLRATIEGRGKGAVRRCTFTTGDFVEPIAVWDEPKRLRFDVVSLPPPMQEWTPYRQVRPPHLEGFLHAERGEFRLTQLPSGQTRLEGSTWYRHNMWPAAYWQLWSDAIIHRIHLRVLDHIRRQAEQVAAQGPQDPGAAAFD